MHQLVPFRLAFVPPSDHILSHTGKLVVSRLATPVPTSAAEPGALPFEASLSLVPLIDFWRRRAAEEPQGVLAALLPRVEEGLRAVPALTRPIPDPALLEAHRALVELLLAPVISPAFADRDLTAALVPFHSRAFFATAPFQRLLADDEGVLSGRLNLNARPFAYNRAVTAYLHVLHHVYGEQVVFEYPLTATIDDPATGLARHFKMTTDLRFMTVRTVGDPPPLDEAARKRLFAHLSDLNVWRELMPPEHFVFEGFAILCAVDVTDEEVVSTLKRDLLEGESIISGSGFPKLVDRLRAYLQKHSIDLGLAAMEEGQLFLLHKPLPSSPDALFYRTTHHELSDLRSSIFGRCVDEGRMQVLEDLAALDERAPIEEEMLEIGIRSLFAAPLYYQAKLIGIFYVWSKEPFAIDELDGMKLLEVIPLFAAAVRRGKEELRNRIQSVILGEYTAIHPCVEWRFRRAALNYIWNREQNGTAEVEPIIFRDVYPLYAATDVRSSSAHRNEAARVDLLDHLDLAHQVLDAAREAKPLILLDHLHTRLAGFMESLQRGLSTGDEPSIRDFLHRDVEPLFDHMRTFSPSVAGPIDAYWNAIDPEHGTLYRRYRDFDESLTQVNRTIAAYLDVEEAKAQAVVPHYFERHQTDGVEFSIYAGASLLEGDAPFDPLYIRNLRLWQLMVVCGIAQRLEPLKKELPVPLDTTHLVLVNSAPLSIRFRFDETRFDVDGTHDVLFEIMKQRIDKARLKGRRERLTQPGKIAIVYSHEREHAEYSGYVRSLQRAGYLEDEIEELEVEDLQGVKGLRAMRVAIRLGDRARTIEIAPEVIEEVVRAMPAS